MEWAIQSDHYILIVVLLALLTSALVYWHRRKNKYAGRPVIDMGECNAIGTRETQEDAGGAVETAWGILTVLADGMGKGNAGKIAALTTVRKFLELFTSHDITGNIHYFFNQAFNRSNREVLERLQGARGGTAAAAALISKGHLHYASVGDIKIAVFRKKELISINDGHTLKTAAAKGFSRGILSREQALALSKTDRQINYIGREGFKNIEIGTEPVKLTPGDIIILMNDGLYKCLSWVELESILTQPLSCQQLAERIIELFNRKRVPDKDNASLFVLRYNGV